MPTLKKITQMRTKLGAITSEYDERVMSQGSPDEKAALVFEKLRMVEAAVVEVQCAVEPLLDREDMRELQEGADELMAFVEDLRDQFPELEATSPPE